MGISNCTGGQAFSYWASPCIFSHDYAERPWLLGVLITSLVLRAISQPLLSIYPTQAWRIGLLGSGILEVMAYLRGCVLCAGHRQYH